MADINPTVQAPLNKARKDKFRLILTLPPIMRDINIRTPREDFFVNLDSLQFSIYNITVPKITIPEVPLHIYQQNYNVTSYDRPPYPPAAINFAIDNEFKNYWVLWKWLELINDPLNAGYISKEAYPFNPPKTIPEQYNYVTDMVVVGMDEYNKDKIKFTFKYAFITTLGELVYNFRDPEETDCYFEFVFNQLDITLL